MRAKRAVIASQKARGFARLAQISFDFAQDRLSTAKSGRLGRQQIMNLLVN
jgi:hypothetical protein